MNLTLTRKNYGAAGILGELRTDQGKLLCYTLEHAYLTNSQWRPKVAPGTYICERHEPEDLPYQTFELQNVPPFEGNPVTGILIHMGNSMSDSKGCILVGKYQIRNSYLSDSHDAFQTLMTLQKTVDAFRLTIT